MSNEEYMDIRAVMAQRGTRGGELKRLPVTLVSKERAEHLDLVEERMRKLMIAAPFVTGALAFAFGLVL